MRRSLLLFITLVSGIGSFPEVSWSLLQRSTGGRWRSGRCGLDIGHSYGWAAERAASLREWICASRFRGEATTTIDRSATFPAQRPLERPSQSRAAPL